MNGSVLDIQDVKNEKAAKKKLENEEIIWNLLRKRDPVSYDHKKWSQPKYSDFSFRHL